MKRKKQVSPIYFRLGKWLFTHKWLFLIICIAFFVRLYRIDYPLLDWHSWRQVDTASVTREYVQHGIDLLHPRYHDLSSLPSGKDNPHGYRMVEFPFINAGIASLIQIFPFLSLVATSRFISILFSLGTLVSLYVFVKQWFGKQTALMSSFVFALLPYSVYYSRVVLPEPAMLFFSTVSLMSFSLWIHFNHWKWYLTSAFTLVLAFLLKPFVGFLLPLFFVLSCMKMLQLTKEKDIFTALPQLQKKRVELFKLFVLFIVFGGISILPFFVWRQWIEQFSEGIPASKWLFNGAAFQGESIRFKPAWFRWLFYERLTKLMLGWVGLVFVPFAFFTFPLILKKTKNISFFSFFSRSVKKWNWQSFCILVSWWLGILLYFSVIATGNVQHDYYQILVIPILSLTVGRGIVMIEKILFFFSPQTLRPWVSQGIIGILLLGMFVLSWQQVKGYFNVNHWEYVEAGKAVQELTPEDAKIIAPAYGGDTGFLFQTNRRGWPIGFDIEDKIDKGAEYYISTNYDDEARELEKKYQIVKKTDTYILIQLK